MICERFIAKGSNLYIVKRSNLFQVNLGFAVVDRFISAVFQVQVQQDRNLVYGP